MDDLTPVPPARFLWAAAGSALVFVATYASLTELSEISIAGFVVAIGLVMLVALLRRKPLLAFTAAAIMGVSVAIAEVAKHMLVRPELIDAPPR